jgi:hypothetical protein
MHIEPHIAALDTTDGFIAQFWRMTQDYPTYQLAYEAVERQRAHHFPGRKYSNYNSFRNVRDKKTVQSD